MNQSYSATINYAIQLANIIDAVSKMLSSIHYSEENMNIFYQPFLVRHVF